MRSFLELLGIDPEAKAQRRASALAKADFDFIRDLVKIRKDQGLSQQDVADRLGITQATVADFERYDNDPKLSTIRRYAHAVEALIVHGVAHDDGQLATGDGWVTITFNAPKSTSTVGPSRIERVVGADQGMFALAA
jgi:DNA-binding XRE family transcriptional regulator